MRNRVETVISYPWPQDFCCFAGAVSAHHSPKTAPSAKSLAPAVSLPMAKPEEVGFFRGSHAKN